MEVELLDTNIYLVFLLHFSAIFVPKSAKINFCIISLYFQSFCTCSIRFQGLEGLSKTPYNLYVLLLYHEACSIQEKKQRLVGSEAE